MWYLCRSRHYEDGDKKLRLKKDTKTRKAVPRRGAAFSVPWNGLITALAFSPFHSDAIRQKAERRIRPIRMAEWSGKKTASLQDRNHVSWWWYPDGERANTAQRNMPAPKAAERQHNTALSEKDSCILSNKTKKTQAYCKIQEKLQASFWKAITQYADTE